MRAGRKFAIGAGLIVLAVGYLIVEGVKQTGVYYFTPTELEQRVSTDTSLYATGVKVGAKVVPGSIRRDPSQQTIAFSISDGHRTIPVTYHGLVPDTFTDASDIDVIVEGRLGHDGLFRATDVLAKCGSRYEAAAKDAGRQV